MVYLLYLQFLGRLILRYMVWQRILASQWIREVYLGGHGLYDQERAVDG